MGLPIPVSLSDSSYPLSSKLLRKVACTLFIIVAGLTLVGLLQPGSFLTSQTPALSLQAPRPRFVKEYSTPGPRSREAYVTFLGKEADGRVNYFREVRRLLFQLGEDFATLDPNPRDFVVVITPDVPMYQVIQLEAEGAIVEGRNELEDVSLPADLQERYRQAYTKLHIFNLTSYDRLLYLDADQYIAKSLVNVWSDPHAQPQSGMAAMSDGSARLGKNHPIPQLDHGYLNAGFLLLRPDANAFEEMLRIIDPPAGFAEQELLNRYFSRDGPRPWEPLNHIFCGNLPSHKDLEAGVHVLHDKLWHKGADLVLRELWLETLARMEQYWKANSGRA